MAQTLNKKETRKGFFFCATVVRETRQSSPNVANIFNISYLKRSLFHAGGENEQPYLKIRCRIIVWRGARVYFSRTRIVVAAFVSVRSLAHQRACWPMGLRRSLA